MELQKMDMSDKPELTDEIKVRIGKIKNLIAADPEHLPYKQLRELYVRHPEIKTMKVLAQVTGLMKSYGAIRNKAAEERWRHEKSKIGHAIMAGVQEAGRIHIDENKPVSAQIEGIARQVANKGLELLEDKKHPVKLADVRDYLKMVTDLEREQRAQNTRDAEPYIMDIRELPLPVMEMIEYWLDSEQLSHDAESWPTDRIEGVYNQLDKDLSKAQKGILDKRRELERLHLELDAVESELAIYSRQYHESTGTLDGYKQRMRHSGTLIPDKDGDEKVRHAHSENAQTSTAQGNAPDHSADSSGVPVPEAPCIKDISDDDDKNDPVFFG